MLYYPCIYYYKVILLLLLKLLYYYSMLLYNILIRGVRIVGIDMPNCVHMPC